GSPPPYWCAAHLRALLSFPTRRSSDLPPGMCCRFGERHPPRPRLLPRGADRPPHPFDRRGPRTAMNQKRPSATETEDRLEVSSRDRKSTRLNSSHVKISYAVFCLKKKK